MKMKYYDLDVSENHSLNWDKLLKKSKNIKPHNIPERLRTGWSVRYEGDGFSFYKLIDGKYHSFYLWDDENNKFNEMGFTYTLMTDVFDPTIHNFDPNLSGLFEEHMDSDTYGEINMWYGYDQTIDQVNQQLDKLGV